jgi:hypothetical protein
VRLAGQSDIPVPGSAAHPKRFRRAWASPNRKGHCGHEHVTKREADECPAPGHYARMSETDLRYWVGVEVQTPGGLWLVV